ncbi:hypothetical protein TA3x_002028 [Tundrisphaera sp. TA3]|uniref:hypothetical protein n=1 Tax=Tundrisphaera sp. TA3 TaxID=3435775 RepID=UPI003EC01A4E
MMKRIGMTLAISGVLVGLSRMPADGGDILGHMRGEPAPPTLSQVARMIDEIQSNILDQGTVVVKQPDVWSQARMTKFRREFEDTMSPELTTFTRYISGRIARSDSASLSSQTALGAALTPFAPGFTPQISTQEQLNSERTTVMGLVTKDGEIATPPIPDASKAPEATFTLLNQVVKGTKDPSVLASSTEFGLEPNVFLDQKADYLTHLQRIRRINLGDDNSDSAGYGLYLMRVPVSIQPGDKTKKGFGAVVNMTMRHDFGPRFLPATYRNLVINDVIDQLAPVVTESIRTGTAYDYWNARRAYLDLKGKLASASATLAPGTPTEFAGIEAEREYLDRLAPSREREEAGLKLTDLLEAMRKISNVAQSLPTSRTGSRTYSIAPSDIKRVFIAQNILNLAYDTQQALDMNFLAWPATAKVKSSDVRSYLRHELESAYDLVEGRCKDQPPLLEDVEYIEDLANQVACRKFEGPKGVAKDSAEERNEFATLYESFTHRLPGNLRYRSIGVLSWAIVIEAGLLNRQLREDMRQTKGVDGYACPADLDVFHFYVPTPLPDAEVAFQEYIKARWPMITFSLEPVTDQQNIEDAFTRRRDLQLAVAFALSSGRISFRQAIQFTRQLQYEAQTIALNQTVAAFAHGTDTFGWRFTPRFQTPPEEGNGRAVANLLLRGGPGPNYQLKNSKIEPGMRELTAVVVMPSFVRGMRLDVDGNWFHLHDPDDRKVDTKRTIELGRRINVARHTLDAACIDGHYRPDDAERLRNKLHQLEVMLPMQTQFVKVPYENTLGGFALFTQGVSALVPELSGFEGVEFLDTTRANEVIVYGKDFSIYETAVVVGGKALPREGQGRAFTTDKDNNPVLVGTALSPLRTADGQQILLTSNGGQINIQDEGSYDILSREVMRVRIPPKVAKAARSDRTEVVEMYVATPNGISNRLAFPVAKPDDPAPAPAPVFGPVQSTASFAFINPEVAVGLSAHRGEKTLLVDAVRKFQTGATLRLQPTDPQAPLPESVNLRFTFPLTGKTILPPIEVAKVPLRDGSYQIDSDGLDALVNKLVGLYKDAGELIPGEVKARQVQVQPVVGGDAELSAGSMALNVPVFAFEFVIGAAPPPPSEPIGEAAPPASAKPATPTATATATATASRNQGTPGANLAAPAGDPLVRRASTAAPREIDPEVRPAQVPPVDDLALPPLPADGTGPATPAPAIAPTAAQAAPAAAQKPATAQTMIVVPSGGTPSVNVSVPIRNEPATTARKHHGLFRRQPAGPAPAKGPLLERIMGRP